MVPPAPVDRAVSTDQTTRSHRPRPTRLVPRSPVMVRFAGTGPAEGPLTLGQLNILEWLSGESEQFFAAVAGALDVPTGTVTNEVTDALAALLGRHEGLRTIYIDGERPRQQVLATGELVVDVYSIESPDLELVDQAGLVRQLTRRLRAAGAYRMTELPIRAALAVLPGGSPESSVVHAAVIGCSHFAVDYQAMEIIKREFADLVRDPAARRIDGPRMQPLDLAALEHTPKALRHSQTVLSYWADRLSRMPGCRYPVPRVTEESGSVCIEMSSTAAALAVHAVAARTRTSRASVALAAICAVVSRRTGYQELVLPTLSGNRFEPHLHRYVGTLAQTTLATVRTGETTFDQLVRQVWAAVVHANRYGSYDVFRRLTIARQVEHERGVVFDYEPLFNSVVVESGPPPRTAEVPTPGELETARSATELRWQSMPEGPTLIRFDLYQTDELIRLGCWSSDIGRIPGSEVESLLLAVENLLIAACGGDLDASRLRESIPLYPVDRGAGWLLVDGCWVELTEVQRLLDDALAPSKARIFAAVDNPSLVAYLARTESVRTPEQAHSRCMVALPSYPTAVAPQHYVICETVPDNPAAWTEVYCEGSGRGCHAARRSRRSVADHPGQT